MANQIFVSFLSAVLLTQLGMAADPPPRLATDVTNALADEWLKCDKVVHLLKALGLYSISGGGAQNKAAVSELEKAGAKDAVDLAEDRLNLRYLLATAAKNLPVDTDQACKDASSDINNLYRDADTDTQYPDAKKELAAVDDEYKKGNYLAALQKLLLVKLNSKGIWKEYIKAAQDDLQSASELKRVNAELPSRQEQVKAISKEADNAKSRADAAVARADGEKAIADRAFQVADAALTGAVSELDKVNRSANASAQNKKDAVRKRKAARDNYDRAQRGVNRAAAEVERAGNLESSAANLRKKAGDAENAINSDLGAANRQKSEADAALKKAQDAVDPALQSIGTYRICYGSGVTGPIKLFGVVFQIYN